MHIWNNRNIIMKKLIATLLCASTLAFAQPFTKDYNQKIVFFYQQLENALEFYKRMKQEEAEAQNAYEMKYSSKDQDRLIYQMKSYVDHLWTCLCIKTIRNNAEAEKRDFLDKNLYQAKIALAKYTHSQESIWKAYKSPTSEEIIKLCSRLHWVLKSYIENDPALKQYLQ